MRLSKYLKGCTEVYHTTLDPRKASAVRIHLIPPKKPKAGIPWVVVLNGYSILPLQTSWAVLLKEFMSALNETKGNALTDLDIEHLIDKTLVQVRAIFKYAKEEDLKEDLGQIVETIKDIAFGKEPNEDIGYMTLSKYAKYMKAPHRMDIMVSAMEKNGRWNCNQHCLHCYASCEAMASTKELSTEEWKHIIDVCRKACIPSLTFTGGEATLREDLVELVEYSKWFVTRLNTNGILLTRDFCDKLYEASLDSVQITLYSSIEDIHNTLVGGKHFKETVTGIQNAIAAGLDVSINTPLCSLNKDYLETLKFASQLGVKYFSCSGLIPSGNAMKENSLGTALSKKEILQIVKEAVSFVRGNEMDLSFTSPGWISEQELRKLKLVVPSCGACLSNMAVAPNGDVIACQSWLNGLSFGNLLKDDWEEIWNHKDCVKIRQRAILKKETCLLGEEERK